MAFLLDANIIIAIFASEAVVLSEMSSAEEVFVPVFAIGELYYGALASSRAVQNTLRVDEFAGSNIVLDYSHETSRHYSVIKNLLRSTGKPLPENDIWISAIAVQYGLDLVTRDAHFKEVYGLRTTMW